MTRKVPKAKIIRAHKLADQLLALWQADIRPFLEAQGGTFAAETENLHDIVRGFRDLRSKVEANAKPQ